MADPASVCEYELMRVLAIFEIWRVKDKGCLRWSKDEFRRHESTKSSSADVAPC